MRASILMSLKLVTPGCYRNGTISPSGSSVCGDDARTCRPGWRTIFGAWALASRDVERNGHLIPVAPRREKLARGRVLLVGDAAGLVDPVTAEGISNAIMSGQLAAAALLESQLVLPEVARRYGSLLRNSILGELRTARFLADFLYNHPRIRGWAFRHQGKRLTNFVADVVMGERDYTSALSARAKTNTVLAGRTLTLCGRAPMGICAG